MNLAEKREENRQISLLDDDEKQKEIMLMNDNETKRKIFERRQLKATSVCNPIVDWTTKELWDYIEAEHIKINPLYQCGFLRVGCIGCPMAGKKRYFEFQVFPKYKQMYLNAFRKMLEEIRKAKGKEAIWKNEYDVFAWWMEENEIPGQMVLEDFYEYET